MTLEHVIQSIREKGDPGHLKGYDRFGIKPQHAFGVKTPELRKLAKTIKMDHHLALQLWESGYHEARMLAAYIADPRQLAGRTMEKWVSEIYSWDLCDALGNLFADVPIGYEKAREWTSRKPEFEKRQGFVTLVAIAIHHKKTPDERIAEFIPYCEKEAWDERHYVKKAVSWLLRTIGKRSLYLHPLAVETCEKILQQDASSAKWIARDALRELKSAKVLNRLQKKDR